MRYHQISNILYHNSSVKNREAIFQHGLQRANSETAELAREMGEADWQMAGGIFFTDTCKPEPGIDVWEVDISGLPLETDETTDHGHLDEHWFVDWESDVIPPSRLNLLTDIHLHESVGKAKPARLPATPENIARAKEFVMKKWIERFRERSGPNASPPTDLTDSCKFSSLFAQEVFGGSLRGNGDHQYVETPKGEIIDLNIDAQDVKQLGDRAHRHDDLFWGSRDHRVSLNSCRGRVADWVKEFLD